MLIIAFTSSAIILFQSFPTLWNITWASLHGANLGSALLWPLIALVTEWGGYHQLKTYRNKYRDVIFILLSLCIIIALEFLLPASPRKMQVEQQGLNELQIRNVTDEILLSANGNPQGIRLSHEVIFPNTGGIYSIIPRSYAIPNAQEEQKNLRFTTLNQKSSIEPTPPLDASGAYQFQPGVTYHFTYDAMPGFLFYNKKRNDTCIMLSPDKLHNTQALLQMIANAPKTPYVIKLSRINHAALSPKGTAIDYTTQHAYSVREIYEGAISDGTKQCDINTLF